MSKLTRPKAWHKDSKVMMAVAGIIYVHGKIIVDWDGKKNYKEVPADQFEILQPTGFTDVTGKMKFVGDVLTNEYSTHVVVWSETRGGFFSKSMGGGFYQMTDVTVSDMRIVGNIYQNPELIKKKVQS